ncbi:MAG: phosphatase PAP2 family protein [Propionibacteriales bacterium]|nr:phosphatase PAP2 family protein [Propionibacteriales bacterium]
MSSATTSPRSRAGGRSWSAVIGTLVLAWAILLGLVIGVGRLLTDPLEHSVGSSDNALARWFVGERTSSLNGVAESLDLLGDTRTVLVLAPLIALGIGLWRHDVRPALFVALTTVGASGIYVLAANAAHRPRPPVKILDQGLDPTHSFPSGHVGAATALYGLIAVLVWTYAWVARWWVAPVCILPLLVAVSRMYEGAHHLSDVLTSVVYATSWLTVTARTLLPRRSAEDPQR